MRRRTFDERSRGQQSAILSRALVRLAHGCLRSGDVKPLVLVMSKSIGMEQAFVAAALGITPQRASQLFSKGKECLGRLLAEEMLVEDGDAVLHRPEITPMMLSDLEAIRAEVESICAASRSLGIVRSQPTRQPHKRMSNR